MSGNRLAEETSPYLSQHAGNPVHWRAWNEAAFAEARARNKPVLLSIGYSACHWCHVMAHESFENPRIAAAMNARFVNIKVDREERPDVDGIYQHALALLGQQGGWPLTMFLTPEGEPFWGGTYFPPVARWGRPGFEDVLGMVADTYAREPDKVAQNVAGLREGLAHLGKPEAGQAIGMAATDNIARRLARQIDPFHGGLGTAPKFPQPSIFHLLWRAWLRTGNAVFKTSVTHTLDNMCQGGIYDHLAGGFARYSTDERWLVPHFEKMLYDNAQMIDLLSDVWRDTHAPLYRARVRETVAWLLAEMRAPAAADGRWGFASALDADSEGVEGKFYVWSLAEVDVLLGADAPLFARVHDVTAEGNWEATNILNRLSHTLPVSASEDAILANCRQTLLAARGARVRPGRDDKVLADWNGLLIAALVKAARVFAEPDWIDVARRTFQFIVTHMTGADGRLRHSHCRGEARHPATLDDYAAMAGAGLALHEASGETAYLDQVRAWLALVETHHGDPHGGYYFSADDTGLLIARAKHALDNATPAGNGLLADVLARLYYLTGEPIWRERAERLIAAFAGEVEKNGLPLASLINGNELLQRAVQVAVIGERGAPDTGALIGAVTQAALTTIVLAVVAPGATLPAAHPAHGKDPVAGRATAYVCAGPVCSLPITDPAALGVDLEGRRGGRNGFTLAGNTTHPDPLPVPGRGSRASRDG